MEAIKLLNTVTTIGNTIFSNLDTSLSCSILIFLSFLGVSSLISGIRAIYEYDAIAITGSKYGASLIVTYIDVGPSAPLIIPIEAASEGENPKVIATTKASATPRLDCST